MRLQISPLPKTTDRALSRFLSSVVHVLKVRFLGLAGEGESVALKKEVAPLLDESKRGLSETVRLICDVQTSETETLQVRFQDLTFESGRLVKLTKADWIEL